MAESDRDSRTEEPTAKRLSEAFSEGQFARSQDVNIAFSLAAAFIALLFAGPSIAGRVAEIGAFIFGHLHRFEINTSAVANLVGAVFGVLGALSFPIVATCLVAGVAASGLQTGFRLTPKVLEVKWERLNFVQGFSRVLSKAVFAQLGIDLLKLAALGAVLWGAIRRILDDPIFYTPVDIRHVGTFILDSSLYVLVRITVACGIIAVISYVYQWRKTRKDLRMTREEVKQERKNSEIDPHVKSAQRALARRLLQRQMLAGVPTSDVVVTNPTHFAVALKYERGRDRAPVVIAKGRDVFARRIKEIAARHEVPVVENKAVARALYRYGQVGREIPAQLYQAVAQILGFVYRTHRYYFHRLKARRLGASA
jgi:flagellar biosynthetic protein FlhB